MSVLGMDDYLAQSLTRSPRVVRAGAVTLTIDSGVIASLDEAWEEGETDLVVELIDLYLGDAPQWVDAMRAAASGEDATALKRAAHTLKGSSGSLGIRQVAETCRRLEQSDCSDSAGGVAALLLRLDCDFARARAALAAERMRRAA